MTLTDDDLRRLSPRAVPFGDGLREAAARYEINTGLRMAHWLAQLAHESMGFAHTRELWGPTPTQLRYEGRRDLGNIEPGDGKRFMGRGLIQITGRANYAAASTELHGDDRLLANPELLEQARDAAVSAGWFWFRRNLSARADVDDLSAITRRINGGLNGLDGRLAWLGKTKAIWRSA